MLYVNTGHAFRAEPRQRPMLILKPPVTNKTLVAKLRNPTIPVTQHREPQNGSNNDKLSEAAIDPLSQVRII